LNFRRIDASSAHRSFPFYSIERTPSRSSAILSAILIVNFQQGFELRIPL
jgi:hypothetical protein